MISDKFIVINVVQNQDYFNVRYQVKPFMLWIWLSVLLISFGGLLSLFKKIMNNKILKITTIAIFIIIFV